MAEQTLEGKKVLVTGGAGFIGSELVRQLADGGATVIAVDNLINGKRENLEEVLGNQIRLEVVDIRDSEAMAKLLIDIDVMYHLACLGVRHSIHDPAENHAVNASATLKLLALSRSENVGRFVYVSTSEVYGTARQTPMTEEHPTMPHTVYGGSKLAGECYTRAYFDTYGYSTVIVRPFNAFGPRSHHEGDSGEVIPKFMLRCLAGQPMVIFGDGSQTRDFTFVGDTARGILQAGLSDRALGETINLGQGKEITVRELADHIRAVTGNADAEIVHDDPRPGDVLRLFADSGKAGELLGFAPQIGLADGLEHLREWYASLGLAPDTLLEEEVRYNWRTDGT
jgi:UDP-glucose 4-epimerase